MKHKAQGSITIFLALMLSLLVSLTAAGLESVRHAAARTQILAAVDVGLYSLFAEYDRTLLEKYNIFALDASGGDGLADLVSLYSEYEAYAKPILRQNSQRLSILQGGLDGYSLLTDEGGEVFFRQVVEYMQQTLGAQGISMVQSRLRGQQISTDQAENAGREAEARRTLEGYQDEMDSAAEKTRQEEERLRNEAQPVIPEPNGEEQPFLDFSPEGSEPSFSSGEEQQEVENPIPFIRQVRRMGLLGLVLPSDRELSDVRMADEFFLSRRTMQRGLGMEEWCQRENSLMGDALFQQYLIQKLGCYRRPASHGMRYQIEYIIGGKTSDRENLDDIATRLLLIREGVNCVCLMSNPAMMSEISALALGIASGFLIPPAAGVIEAALVLCWSFAESILDLRELFSGGRVPLVKSGIDWQLSLANLTRVLERLDIDRRSDPNGMSYEDYLQVLLLPKSRDEKAMGGMDMIEQSLRTMNGWGSFRLDSCVVGLSVYAVILVNRSRAVTTQKTYGYS